MTLVAGAAALEAFDPGGIDVLTADVSAYAGVLRRENHTLKRALTDPRLFDGIGNVALGRDPARGEAVPAGAHEPPVGHGGRAPVPGHRTDNVVMDRTPPRGGSGSLSREGDGVP